MSDFFSQAVKRLTSLENRISSLESRGRAKEPWLKRRSIVYMASNTVDATGLGYIALNPTPATQNLNTISGGGNGQVLFLRVNGASDAVTVKDSVDNISLPFSGDILLDDPEKVICLIYDSYVGASGLWLEVKSA